MNLGLIVVRIVLGLLFVGHGSQKLFGSFGGHGLEGTGGFFESLHLRPGRLMALGAGAAELGGGVLIALGLLTPIGALLITATMVTAIATAHWQKGVWNTDGGYEYNALIVAVVFALAALGPGAWSLDHGLGIGIAGDGWALGQLVLGLLGSAGTIAIGRRGYARRTPPRRPTAATPA